MPYPSIPDSPANQASPIDGQKATYVVTALGIVSATSATDIFALTGSATKTIRISRVVVSGTATTIQQTDVQLIKRVTADTGTTASTPTPFAYDSTSPAATATCATYTANPTITSTGSGTIHVQKVLFNLPTPASAYAVASEKMVCDYGNRPAKEIVLRGIAEQLVVNLNAVTVAGPLIDVTVEFTEE